MVIARPVSMMASFGARGQALDLATRSWPRKICMQEVVYVPAGREREVAQNHHRELGRAQVQHRGEVLLAGLQRVVHQPAGHGERHEHVLQAERHVGAGGRALSMPHEEAGLRPLAVVSAPARTNPEIRRRFADPSSVARRRSLGPEAIGLFECPGNPRDTRGPTRARSRSARTPTARHALDLRARAAASCSTKRNTSLVQWKGPER